MIPHFFLPEKKSFYIVIPNTDQDEVKKKKKKPFPISLIVVWNVSTFGTAI